MTIFYNVLPKQPKNRPHFDSKLVYTLSWLDRLDIKRAVKKKQVFHHTLSFIGVSNLTCCQLENNHLCLTAESEGCFELITVFRRVDFTVDLAWFVFHISRLLSELGKCLFRFLLACVLSLNMNITLTVI